MPSERSYTVSTKRQEDSKWRKTEGEQRKKHEEWSKRIERIVKIDNRSISTG